ncbi:MAG: peptidoglycan editing factor PgeF [Ruminococcaceae bacterium]|nr:peptidoglycan editing factor PgeF [Oscillospiraceae bacterium]
MGFVFETKGGLGYFRAENIKAKHGFSTRMGGVSVLPHLFSLNLAFGRGDDEDTVRKNIEIFCSAIEVPQDSVISAKQIHSAKVLRVGPEDKGLESTECDGFVTDKKGVTLCVKVADCVPVLLCDGERRIVSAVHAGWRGSAAGICVNAVREMLKIGADIKNINAAIGPSIHSCCFEVGEDYREALKDMLGSKSERYIIQKNGSLFSDIVRMNRDMLLEAGLKEENICESGRCSCCEPELFFSHRASKGKRGTMAAMISL